MRYFIFLFSLQCSLSFGQQIILSTDFQQGIPSTYTIIDNDFNIPSSQVAEYTNAWISTIDTDFPNDTVAASTSFFEPAGTANRWLITPPLSLSSFGNFIQWNARSQDASWPDDYLVVISTTNADPLSFTDTIGYIQEENVEWTTRQINLSGEGYVNQQVYIAFVNVTNDGFKLYLDDIAARIDDPVGITEQTSSSLAAFPNPTTGLITISSNQPINRVEIHSINGSKMGDFYSNQLDLTAYSTGIYFAKIFCEGRTEVLRIQKN